MRTVLAPSKSLVGRHDAELALEAVEVVVQLVDQVGLDGVLDDRVALLGDLVQLVHASDRRWSIGHGWRYRSRSGRARFRDRG